MKMLTKILVVSSLLFITFSSKNVKATEMNIFINRWNIQLTSEEVEILSRIVQLECGYDIRESKFATVEIILNRMIDPRYPNTLTEVLSQRGQFSTWKNVNSTRAIPTKDTYDCVIMVLNGQTNILEIDRFKFNNKRYR